jgi:hypothetical protein
MGITTSGPTSKHAILMEHLLLRRNESVQKRPDSIISSRCKPRSPKQPQTFSSLGTKIVYTFIVPLSWAMSPPVHPT